MYPDVLIYDEIKRRQQKEWEPVPLELPLYQPYWPDPKDKEELEEEEPVERGVVIIDMNDYSIISDDND